MLNLAVRKVTNDWTFLWVSRCTAATYRLPLHALRTPASTNATNTPLRSTHRVLHWPQTSFYSCQQVRGSTSLSGALWRHRYISDSEVMCWELARRVCTISCKSLSHIAYSKFSPYVTLRQAPQYCLLQGHCAQLGVWSPTFRSNVATSPLKVSVRHPATRRHISTQKTPFPQTQGLQAIRDSQGSL